MLGQQTVCQTRTFLRKLGTNRMPNKNILRKHRKNKTRQIWRVLVCWHGLCLVWQIKKFLAYLYTTSGQEALLSAVIVFSQLQQPLCNLRLGGAILNILHRAHRSTGKVFTLNVLAIASGSCALICQTYADCLRAAETKCCYYLYHCCTLYCFR